MGTKSLSRITVTLISVIFISFNLPFFAYAHGPTFTREEQEFITIKGVVKAVSLEGGAPVQYRNSRGEVKGISINFLEKIKDLSGLRFEYELYDSIEEGLRSGADLLFSSPGNINCLA